jgi:hypothetical protein
MEQTTSIGYNDMIELYGVISACRKRLQNVEVKDQTQSMVEKDQILSMLERAELIIDSYIS